MIDAYPVSMQALFNNPFSNLFYNEIYSHSLFQDTKAVLPPLNFKLAHSSLFDRDLS